LGSREQPLDASTTSPSLRHRRPWRSTGIPRHKTARTFTAPRQGKEYPLHFKAGKEHGPHSTKNGCKLLVLWTERTSKEAADLSDFVIAKKAA